MEEKQVSLQLNEVRAKAGCNSFLLHNSSQRWKWVPPVVETGVNTLSVDAGIESCRLLEGRSSNYENNGPLHSGQLFPVREPGFQR
jgi:hypothetical protein